MPIWLMIGGAGLATLCARALFSMLPRSWELPAGVQALLEDLPVAVFAALAMPGLLGEGALAPSLSSGRSSEPIRLQSGFTAIPATRANDRE